MSQPKPCSRRIFIADDDPDDLDLYQEIIAKIPGNSITCFSDGKYQGPARFDHTRHQYASLDGRENCGRDQGNRSSAEYQDCNHYHFQV
jgi:hypothetical protein